MASNNTTFTAITSGTRDSSNDKGAVYYLDGNTTNGRLNISDGATWIAGDNTTVVYDGNTNHTFMQGTIQGNDFKIIAVPNNNGRVDFGNKTCGWNVDNISFVYLGDGSIYNHLEDDNNRSNFKGITKFTIDMDAGEAFIQFTSKEYQNITVNVSDSNNAVLNIFPARSSAGFTSLTGFKTIGLTSAALKTGLTSTSHGRIYDPVYDGVENNLLPLQTDSTSDSNRAIEYFSIDVTSISNADTRAIVKDSNGTVLFNDNLNSSLLEPKANDNTTILDFYSGKKVILCEVRRINNILNSTRNQIEYTIRRNGYNQIKQELFSMNNPISINDMTIDTNYSNNNGLTEISNSEEFYDMYKNLLTEEIDIDDVISANGNSIVIANGWSLVRNQEISSAVEVDTNTNRIKVKTGANGLQATDKFTGFIGNVDSSFDGNTDMSFILVANQTNLRLSNLEVGASVAVIRNSDGVEVGELIQSTGTTGEIIIPYTSDYEVTIRIIADGFVMSDTITNMSEGVVLFTAPNMQTSYGQVDTALRVRNVDGVNIGLGASSFIDVDTTNKTFDMVEAFNGRSILTGIMRSWDEPELNEIFQPCVVDDVRGLSLYDGWTFTNGTLTNNRFEDEGYVTRDSNGVITDLKYNVKIEDNPIEVRYQIYNNSIGQGIVFISQSGTNTLEDIDYTLDRVYIRVRAKHPQYQYKNVLEDIILDGEVVADRFRLRDTIYLVAPDPLITEDLRSGYNTDYTYNSLSVDVDDFEGTTRTFDNGTIDLEAGTTELQDVMNQLAGLTSAVFNFDTKLFSVRATGGIDIDQGYYITVGGAPLGGSLRGLIKLYDEDGNSFVTPEFRNITMTLPNTWAGSDLNYVAILNNANVLTNSPDYLVDANGDNVVGTIESGETKTISIQTNVDTNIRIIYGNAETDIHEHRETLDADGINFDMVAHEETIMLYKDETLSNDNTQVGTKAWYPEIDNISIDEATRVITIPDAILNCEVNYIYRAWRKWVNTDLANRLKYGIALIGNNILKPASADDDDNSYLFNPEWGFGFSWRVDVLATRPILTSIKFLASKIERVDTTQGFTQQHNGLIYPIPLANSSAPIEVIVVGATNKTLTDILNRTQDNYNLLKTDGVVLLSETQSTIDDTKTLLDTVDRKVDTVDTVVDSIETKVDTIDTVADAVKVKTDNLPTNTENTLNSLDTKLNTIDSTVDDIKTKTDNLPTDTDAVLTSVETKIDTVDTVVDAIKTEVDTHPTLEEVEASTILAKEATIDVVKVKTDNLPNDTASELTALDGKIDTVDTKVNTVDVIVDAIKLRTDNMPQS